jgi:hypothetical protein
METRSIPNRPDVVIAPTSPRVTPTPPRAARFGEVLSNTVVRSAEAAVRSLPGSPMMALAVRGGAVGVPATTLARTGSPLPEGPTTSAAGGLPGGLGAPGAGGTESANIESSLQQSQEMNLYYLQVQEQVNAENRSFTTLSNVLKAEHDTVKTAIGNIR